ncbi:sulfatase-like hydrolase/transferase [Thermodesulfobacteriota bacterium]
MSRNGEQSPRLRIGAIGRLAAWVVVAMVVMEAMFQLSKTPNYFDRFDRIESLLLISTILAGLLATVIVINLAFRIILGLLSLVSPKLVGVIETISAAMVFFVLLAVVLTFTDTWIYSVSGKEIFHLKYPTTLLLLAGIVVLNVLLVVRYMPRFEAKPPKFGAAALALIILVLAGGLVKGAFLHKEENVELPVASAGKARKAPNIILFSSDGVERSHLSVYGYDRKTTPNLDQLASVSNVYERAYTNSGNTTGSLCSILTGKSPFTTKVIYAPDMLQGKDSFEHLPGILNQLGYFCVSLGSVAFCSPGKLNILDGFDLDNSQGLYKTKNRYLRKFRLVFNYELYFINNTLERIANRLKFLAGSSTGLRREREGWKGEEPKWLSDSEQVRFLNRLIEECPKPLFCQIHLMGTHGPLFKPAERVFSKGKEEIDEWDGDSFDDSILTMDSLLGRCMSALKKSGKWRNTLFIFFTDHGQKFTFHKPLPLIVHLPGQESKRVVDAPVQSIDLAPSILKCLGVPVPKWMEGNPIFPQYDSQQLFKRPIFTGRSCEVVRGGEGHTERNPAFSGPPLWGFCQAQIVMGDKVVSVHARFNTTRCWRAKKDGSLSPFACRKEPRLKQFLLEFLRSREITYPGGE